MNEWLQLAQALGPVGIIALTAIIIARAIAPAINGLVDARKEANDINRRNAERWEASDKTVEQNTSALVAIKTAMEAISARQSEQNEIDVGRVEQNKIIHKNVMAMSENMLQVGEAVAGIARSLATERGDVVTGVSKAMTEHLNQRDEKLSTERTERDKVVDERLDALAHDTGDIKRMLIAMAAALGVEIKDVSFTRVATPEPPDPNEGLAKDTDDA